MTDKDQLNTDETDVPLGDLSDEEILKLDPTDLPGIDDINDFEENQPVIEDETDDTDTEETGGAASVDTSDSDEDEGTGSTSAEFDLDLGTGSQSEDKPEERTISDQDTANEQQETSEADDQSSEIDYKAEYERVMAPLKAAKREITPRSPEDIRRLAQMGADYSRKMEAMKPYQRILKTLERNDLLDVEKVNFLIDLDKKNPEAIKKFLKDSEIDPMDLDLEDSTDYKPNDHMLGDKDLALEAVLDDISGSETFDRTIDTITNEWDKASKQILMDTPKIIQVLNTHMEQGVFDMIAEKVGEERTFGRLMGLSDLEAYKTVGDAMQKAGAFNNANPGATSSGGNTNQDFSQDSGSKSSKDDSDIKNRKRAASPTKGNASAGKPKINLALLSDEEILKIDPATL